MGDDREQMGIISATTSTTIRSMYALCSEMNSFVIFQNASILMGDFISEARELPRNHPRVPGGMRRL
jgi:hypothetical protein